ncbi:tyrosine-type recombinase/integrase [Methylobacterium sp. HMF5984]|uniref:tyrosine-type recombinase/integrase n=1 Tax=Methylobacterium sp. HMF5984 TaxID=3367370 RepID=UPI0038540D36
MTADMPRPRPPHLVREETRHGRVVWYVRVGQGPRTRMHEAYDTKEFWRDYRLAVEGKPVKQTGPVAGTVSWLIAKYLSTGDWSDLAAATRKQRHTVYRIVEQAVGNEAIKHLDHANLLEARDRRRDKPHAANNFIKAMRGLFQWAVAANHVKIDPTIGIKLLVGSNDDVGFHAWTEEEVARFEAKWPTGSRQRLAFDLLLYTGLRRGDAVRLGRPHVRNGEFTIRTEKTGMVVIAPIMPALAASIAAAPTGELTFIATERGRPFTKESFGTWFGKACRAAKCPGSAHGLRKAGARRVAEDGASEAQLNALFGWTDGSRESAVYTRTASRAKLAREARRIPAPIDPVRDANLKAQ